MATLLTTGSGFAPQQVHPTTTTPLSLNKQQQHNYDWPLCSTKKSRASSKSQQQEDTSILDLEEPAGVVGAQFFGGNKEKVEFFDPVAEAQAGEEIKVADTVYNRFQDTQAFETPQVAQMAQSLQKQLNSLLYETAAASTTSEEAAAGESDPIRKVQYSANLSWDSCFDTKSSKSPLTALQDALNFYKELDVAIVSGKQISDNRVQLQWQISVMWPIFWEPRVLLSGCSDITFQKDSSSGGTATVSKQVDMLDSSSDFLSTISSQLMPRFWDTYHIGMTPSAEIMTRVVRKQGLLPKPYNLFEIPPRLVSAPTQLDSPDGRADGNAQIIPNHAFSCVIKTMGPQKQDFGTASPLEVQILPPGKGQGSPPRFKWSIPLSVYFQTTTDLPIPGEDPEARPSSEPTCEYEFQPRRLVATLPFGGTPQDVEIADVRKKLYDAIIKDGLKPALDENGRPQFFFLQDGVKACYTEEGLGMCVYEWRPKAVNPNEVGIELEL